MDALWRWGRRRLMGLRELTTIGRPLDPDYATNRAIAALTVAAVVGGTVWRRLGGGGWSASLLWGLQMGLTTFLTWALCRELDPDHPPAAFVAVGLAVPVALYCELPQLNVIVWLLVVLRVLNRTVGLSAGILDILALMALGSWLSLEGNWGYGLITALALLLDRWLPGGKRRQLLFGLIALLITMAIALLVGGAPQQGSASLPGGLIALSLSILFVPVILASGSIESVGDRTSEPLEPVRVQAAQIIAVLAGLETALLVGPAAIVRLAPLWAGILGSAMARLTTRIFREFNRAERS